MLDFDLYPKEVYEKLDYFIGLRKDLLSQIGWIPDSYSDWIHTRCNKDTKQSLILLLDKYVREANKFNVFLVTAYMEEPTYRKNLDGIVIKDGEPVVQGDPDYTWGAQLYLGTLGDRRPYLFKSNPSVENLLMSRFYEKQKNSMVCERLIFKKDSQTPETINAIFDDIAKAVSRAYEKQPRSGIREYLLRALIRVNDNILPFTVEEYITHINTLKSDER